MKNCLAKGLNPTSSLYSEHAANMLWISVRSGINAGYFAENSALHKTHLFAGNSGSSILFEPVAIIYSTACINPKHNIRICREIAAEITAIDA